MSTQGWQRDNPNQRQRQTPQPGTGTPAGGAGGGFMGLGGGQKPTPGKVLNFMFNPELGKSISPLKQTGGLFTRMLALVFSQHGLFPRNHPGLTDKTGETRLGLGEVIGTAWQTLRWEKDNILQIIFFFSIIALIVFTALTLITGLFSLFLGTAHAQGSGGGGSGGFFGLSDGDLSKQFIDYVFFAEPISAPGFPQAAGMQTAIQTMLEFYSSAMLVVAAFILMYHLVSMVAETAHHGVAFGKRASQIWAPVRLVVAIGLLVPLAGGLSSGQLIVIQVGSWGSGLATGVWNKFVGAIESGQAMNPPKAANISVLANAIIQSYACSEAYNIYIRQSDIPEENKWLIEPRPFGTAAVKFGNRAIFDGELCGGFTVPAAPAAASPAIAAIYTAVGSAASDTSVFAEIGKKLATAYHPYSGNQSATPPTAGEIDSAIVAYQESIDNAARQAFQNQPADEINTDAGWPSAGSWLYKMASTQAGILEAGISSIPTPLIPTTQDNFWRSWLGSDGNQRSSANYNGDILGELQNNGEEVTAIMTRVRAYLRNAAPADGGGTTGGSGSAGGSGSGSSRTVQAPSGNTMMVILGFYEYILSSFHVWDTDGAVAIKLDSGSDPFVEFVTFGHNWINGNMDFMSWGIWLLVGGNILSLAGPFIIILGALGSIASVAGGVMLFIGLLGLVPGIMVAFLVPMLPFIKFFFNTLTWVLSFFEAVLAVPLVALAHINPNGEGLPGDYARGAYFLILNVFLRPVLMVFGLAVGMGIFYVAVGLLNYGFEMAASSATPEGTTPLSRIIFTIIYMILVYTSANSAFKGIDFFPSNALRWIGQSGHSEKMGDAQTMQQALVIGGALVGEKAISQIQGTAEGLTKAVAPLVAPRKPPDKPDQPKDGGGGGGGDGGGDDKK